MADPRKDQDISPPVRKDDAVEHAADPRTDKPPGESRSFDPNVDAPTPSPGDGADPAEGKR